MILQEGGTAVAAVVPQEGGTAAAALQISGSLGASPLPYSSWEELVAASFVRCAGGGNGGGGSTGRQKRRRRLCKTAEMAAASLQEGGSLGAPSPPYSRRFKGDPDRDSLFLSHVGMGESHQHIIHFLHFKNICAITHSSLPYIGERKRGGLP